MKFLESLKGAWGSVKSFSRKVLRSAANGLSAKDSAEIAQAGRNMKKPLKADTFESFPKISEAKQREIQRFLDECYDANKL